jgi:hypothetical protein
MSGNAEKRAKPPGIGEFLFNELRHAFQDIRQKVVEEGWFGRVVTAAPVIELGKDQPVSDDRERASESPIVAPEHRPTFEELWGPRERSPDSRQQERQHQHNMDIER